MRTRELEARHQASAVVSGMMLTCCLSMLEGYRQKNLGSSWPEMLVTMAVQANDAEGKPPISGIKIAKLLKTSRQNVSNWLKPLVRHGVVKRSGQWGYVGDDAFLQDRVDAPYFKRIVAAIRAAAEDLRDFPL